MPPAAHPIRQQLKEATADAMTSSSTATLSVNYDVVVPQLITLVSIKGGGTR
jgi:hypothetical protein